MPTQFPTQAAAEAAIAQAKAAGRIESGHAQVSFGGRGGAAVYMAHVRTVAGSTRCL